MFDFHKSELEKAENLWKNNITVSEDGVVSWKSNGRQPFSDMLDLFIENGHGGEFSKEATEAARDAETKASIRAYKEQKREYSEEEISEMRAAFGDGTAVVDVLSGRRFSL